MQFRLATILGGIASVFVLTLLSLALVAKAQDRGGLDPRSRSDQESSEEPFPRSPKDPFPRSSKDPFPRGTLDPRERSSGPGDRRTLGTTPGPAPVGRLDAAAAAQRVEQQAQELATAQRDTVARLETRLLERSRAQMRTLEQSNEALLEQLDLPADLAEALEYSIDEPANATGSGKPAIGLKPQLQDASVMQDLVESMNSGCAGVDCLKLDGFFNITSVVGAVTPGGLVVVHGEFGASGQILLHYKNWKNEAKWEPLATKAWTQKAVAVQVPLYLRQFRDQVAQLQARRWELYGPKKDVSLKATVEHRVLGYPDPAITVTKCDHDANVNCCNGKKDTSDPLYTAGAGFHHPCSSSAAVTISGAHRNSWGAIGDDSGKDLYRIALQNDWIMTDVEIHAKPPCCSTTSQAGGYQCWDADCVDQPNTPFPTGGTLWTPGFHWVVTPADTIGYSATVTISGPREVPHH